MHIERCIQKATDTNNDTSPSLYTVLLHYLHLSTIKYQVRLTAFVTYVNRNILGFRKYD